MTANNFELIPPSSRHFLPTFSRGGRERLDLSLKGNQIERARQLKRDGHPVGEPVGAGEIEKILASECKAQKVQLLYAERTISRKISKTPFAPDESPYSVTDSHLPDHAKSYAARLNLLKGGMFSGDRLTNREASMSLRTLVEFEDPHGDAVDLIAQFAVVWELAERAATNEPCEDIESMFAFAPWRGDSHTYRLAIENRLVNAPRLRLITPLLVKDGETQAVHPMFIGAHGQLNLPYYVGWFANRPEGVEYRFAYRDDERLLNDRGVSTNAEDTKSDCNWREYIRKRLSGVPTEQVTLALGRDGTKEKIND
jgi:hypothetical protein